MRKLPSISLLIVFMFSCGENQSFTEYASSEYYSNNEDHFGFLVFDKSNIDTFFKYYLPLDPLNDSLKIAFKKLARQNTPTSSLDTLGLSKHTDNPKPTDYKYAKRYLIDTDGNSEENFAGNIRYLFFFDCLPNELQYKWPQTRLGDFEFNVTFFNRLRTHCSIFDKTVYGDSGHWDRNIRSVFKHDIFNEISAENAELIKNCILNDTSFNDIRLKTDKDNFLMFLNKTIQRQWRLFLIDKN